MCVRERDVILREGSGGHKCIGVPLFEEKPASKGQRPIIPLALFTCEMLAPSAGSSRERWVPSVKGSPKFRPHTLGVRYHAHHWDKDEDCSQ